MPATGNVNGATGDYLRGQPPAWPAIQGGLSVFAAVVILRLCIRRFQKGLSRTDGLAAAEEPKATNCNDTPEKHLFRPHHSCQLHQPYAPWTMNEKESGLGGGGGGGRDHHVSFRTDESASRAPLHGDPRFKTGADAVLRNLMSRPPPAPPLTPPELSSTVFTLQGRPLSQDSLIHQPNPDYASPSTASSGSQPTTATTTSQPKRLSYTKTIPIGVPVSRQSSASESDLFFSPSSYPPTSPLLPPAPPAFPQLSSEDDSPERREISVHGEIVGVLDGNGAGWSRHTRVYGGGSCLACAAAGREHGEGGFYGPNVLPEEMR